MSNSLSTDKITKEDITQYLRNKYMISLSLVYASSTMHLSPGILQEDNHTSIGRKRNIGQLFRENTIYALSEIYILYENVEQRIYQNFFYSYIFLITQ